MATPERMGEVLKEFLEVQARPITDAALAERMRTEATTWINAVHMQHRRSLHPLVDPDLSGHFVWRQEIDLHFLLVALTRLRRSVGLVVRVEALRDTLVDRLTEFDADVPSLALLRNVGEHFDDYTTGRGRQPEIERHQLQTWSLGEEDGQGLVWRWLGVGFPVETAHRAATSLYRGFLADVEDYLGTLVTNAE